MSIKEEIFDKLAQALNEKDTVTSLSLMEQTVEIYKKEKAGEESQKNEIKVNVKQDDNKKQDRPYDAKATIAGKGYASNRLMNILLDVFVEQLTKSGFEGTVTVEVKAHE